MQISNAFSNGFAVGVIALVTRPAALYEMYRMFVPQWIILPLVVLAWLFLVFMLAIGIG